MPFKTIHWNREELYQKIWEKPLCTVAHEYGMSDVGLAKVCKKLQIPRPSRGYWRRKERGFKVSQKPLPAAKGVLRAVSRFWDGPKPEPPPPVPEDNMPVLKMPALSAKKHPMVVQTEQAYAGAADQFGRMRPHWQAAHFDLRVTRTGLHRAIQFLDNLVKLLQANGMSVGPGNDQRTPAVAVVEGEKLRFFIKEEVKGHKRPLNRKEMQDHLRSPTLYPRDYAMQYDGTGRFTFEIENYSGYQRSWADTKTQKLEEELTQIVRGFQAAAQYAKRARAEQQARQLEEMRQYELRRKEQERIERLKKNVAGWQEAERIRAYLDVVQAKAEAKEGGLAVDPAKARFLECARRYADSLDRSGAPAAEDWLE